VDKKGKTDDVQLLDGIGRSAKHGSAASNPTGCRLCQLGRFAIVGASFRWNSAGKSLVSSGKLPVSAGIPVEDCRKRGRLRRCGIGLHPDGPSEGVTRGEGMAGRLVRVSGADRPHRRGGGQSLEPLRPRTLSSSRAENFPQFKRNSNGGHPGQAVGRANAGFAPLRNQMPGIIGCATVKSNEVVQAPIELDTR